MAKNPAKTRVLSKKDGKKVIAIHRQDTEDFLKSLVLHRLVVK